MRQECEASSEAVFGFISACTLANSCEKKR